MKKTLLSSFLLLTLAGWASAFDWAVNVNEVPLAILGDTNLYIEVIKIKPVVTFPAFDANFKLEGEGSYSTSAPNLSSWAPGTLSFDLTEVSLKGITPIEGGKEGVAEWDVGRRMVTDLTSGWIISSRWDGLSAAWQKGHTRYSGSAGYSGLLLKKTAKVSASPADAADLNDTSIQFGPQRVYGLVGASFIEAVWRQDVQFELLGDVDLRKTDAVHGVYGTASVTGPLPLGRQRVFATAALRVATTSSWAYLGGVEWSASLPFLGSRLVLTSTAGKGSDGYGFQPISGKGLAEVVSLTTSAGAALGADFSLKPLPKTTLGAKTTILFRTEQTDPGITGFDTASTAAWLGAEAGLYGSWTPSSDLNIAVSSGIFVPNGGAFVSGTKPTILAVVTSTLKL